MNKRTIITVFIALFAFQGMAQKTPNWVTNKPVPTNDTYLYVVESATGKTEVEARNRAIAEVMRTTAMRLSQPFDSEEISRALQSGREYGVISAQYNIPIYKVCEHVDNNASPCRVYILCQVAKTGDCRPVFDDFNACYEGNDKYYANEALYAVGYDVYRNGKKLSDDEVRTMFANSVSYDLYDKGQRISHSDASLWLFLGGLVLSAGGGALQSFWDGYHGEWDSFDGKAEVLSGLAMIGCGSALWIAAVVTPSIGRSKVRKAVNLYNNGKMYSQTGWAVEYGLNGNGVFLSFSF